MSFAGVGIWSVNRAGSDPTRSSRYWRLDHRGRCACCPPGTASRWSIRGGCPPGGDQRRRRHGRRPAAGREAAGRRCRPRRTPGPAPRIAAADFRRSVDLAATNQPAARHPHPEHRTHPRADVAKTENYDLAPSLRERTKKAKFTRADDRTKMVAGLVAGNSPSEWACSNAIVSLPK